MSEFKIDVVEQERAFAPENARQFISWMFKDVPSDYIAQIPESYLPVMFDILVENATQRLEGIKDRRRKKVLQAPIDHMKKRVEGLSFFKIGEGIGKSEQTISFALSVYAEKLGSLENLDELIEGSRARLLATEAAADDSSPVVDETELPEPPEPKAAIVEIEQSQTPEPAETGDDDSSHTSEELVRLALQEVIEMPPVEKRPLVTPKPRRKKRKKQPPQNYPMVGRLSHRSEELDEMLREAGII